MKSRSFLLAACLLLSLVIAVSALVTAQADKNPDVAVLLVLNSGDARMSKAAAFIESAFNAWIKDEKRGKLSTPVLAYYFDEKADREYCEKELGITADSLLFVGIVEMKDGYPGKILFRHPAAHKGDTDQVAKKLKEELTSILPAGGGSPQGVKIAGSVHPRTIINLKDESRMALIAGGEFWMGSPEGKGEKDEIPQQKIKVDPFYMDVFEVTNSQFEKFVKETDYITTAEKEKSAKNWRACYFAGRENHPVVCVSWFDARAYAQWAGKRLPTEAEWEIAARGTEALIYPWGNEKDISRLNCEEGERGETAPVGNYPGGKSPFDLMDMAGNVWEWTISWYEAYPHSFMVSEKFGETFKVVRGGGFASSIDRCRTPLRGYIPPNEWSDSVGFRCAKTPGRE